MTRFRVAAFVALLSAADGQPALAGGAETIRDCILAAAAVNRIPPGVILILLNVEGGMLGRVSANTNGTVDIGPMQVNDIWLPELAAHWRASLADTLHALRDNFCANVEAGSWILRRGLDEAHGDLWGGVGYYHSHDPEHEAAYLRAVLREVIRLTGGRTPKPVNAPAKSTTQATGRP